MITCRELIDFIAAWRDGGLDARERASFEAHLGACPPCVDYLDSYEKTVALERLCRDAPWAPSPAPEELVRAVLDARRRDA